MGRLKELMDELGIADEGMKAAMAHVLMAEASIPLSAYIARGGRLHTLEACKTTRKAGGPKNCVIHRPSLHRLTGSPQVLRSSALIEDQCPHGVGHPNPDSVAYLNWASDETHWGIHGCDGCCGTAPKFKPRFDWMEGDYPT